MISTTLAAPPTRAPRIPAEPARRSFYGLLLLALALTTPVAASTTQALQQLLDALVQNGTLNAEQASLIRATANPPSAVTPATPVVPEKDRSAPPAVVALPKQKTTTRLIIGGKLHPQWDWLSTDAAPGRDPATRNAFQMRRLELVATGDVGPLWSGSFTADFTSSNPINEAYVTYKGIPGNQLHLGMAKAPFVWEEELSDSVIKGVERSVSHRAVVEHPGRGVGSKIMGLHLHGQRDSGLYYAAAITNAGAKNSAGYAGSTSNELAYWLRLGTAGKMGGIAFNASIDATVHPDLLPTGTLVAGAAHLQLTGNKAGLLAEVVAARYPQSEREAADLRGFMLEPTYRFSDRWEAVLRYSDVDAGGIGLQPGALVRGASATGEYAEISSWYLGGNCYISGQAIKLTFGYEHARASGKVIGPDESNTINALRTRLQLLF